VGRWSIMLAMLLAGAAAAANDLKQLYELALTRDATLQAASFQRDAAIEARPQALAQWLPQLSANASVTRERLAYTSAPSILNSQAADCALGGNSDTQRCYGTARDLGLNLSQTLWSFQAFNQLRESNSQVAAAEASYRGAQEQLLLRVAEAYFAILSASDQLATNRREREAFGTLLNQAKVREQTGVGPRSDVEQAQSFYDATEESVIDAENALDDANLAMTQIVGPHSAQIAPLREEIPLTSPDPASADEWVVSAREDNFDVRAAQLKVDAALSDVSAQRWHWSVPAPEHGRIRSSVATRTWT
jgi:outer membrane protein